MQVKFEPKPWQPIVLDQNESGFMDWSDTTYAFKEPEEVRPKTEVPYVEGMVPNDTLHYTVSNRPIIEVLDSAHAVNVKHINMMVDLEGFFKPTTNFSKISMSGRTITFTRGAYVTNGKFVDYTHQVYFGQTTSITSTMTVNFPTVSIPTQYYIQVDGDGIFWADPILFPSRLAIGLATFDGSNFTQWIDLRSWIGQVDDTDPNDTLKNKMVSNKMMNYIMSQLGSNSESGFVNSVQLQLNQIKANDISMQSQINALNQHLVAESGLENNLQVQINSINNQITSINNTLNNMQNALNRIINWIDVNESGNL